MTLVNFFTDVRSLFTVVSLLTFLGIIFWSYSSRRKADYEVAANLPFADDDLAVESVEKSHG